MREEKRTAGTAYGPAGPIRLEHLVNRYRHDTELLKRHPRDKAFEELLRRRIERHKNDIVEYVASNGFSERLKYFGL